jgi:hypothetical protein
MAAGCGLEREEWCTEHSVGTSAAASENRSGAGGGLQGSGRLVLLSFASILELMIGPVASYVVSLNVHIVVMLCWFMFKSSCISFWHMLRLSMVTTTSVPNCSS